MMCPIVLALLKRARELIRPVEPIPAQMDGWVVCGGPSMAPTVTVGQRVRVRPCERLLPGDVVVFKSRTGEVHVLHRVVLTVPGLPWFVHMGDAPSAKPGLAHTVQVVGRATELPRRRLSKRALLLALNRLAQGARNVAVRVWRDDGPT
jgi:signal peptidase I